jgi:hypothetical protein
VNLLPPPTLLIKPCATGIWANNLAEDFDLVLTGIEVLTLRIYVDLLE